MSGDPADKSEAPRTPRTHPARRRRALRVPITDVPHASALDDQADPYGATDKFESAPFTDWEPPSGVTPAPGPLPDRDDPTEPSFRVEDPLADTQESPTPSIRVEYESFDGSLSSNPSPPEDFEDQATDVRLSEPPEELFLDDADVVSRTELREDAPPDKPAEIAPIPVPKPPPPPSESSEGEPAGATASAPNVSAQPPGPWYEHFFGEHYLRTVRTPTPKEVAIECDFIERALRVPKGARVLDVGCGLGLQTVEMAARGYHMVGLDISATMVSRAYDEAEDRGLQINFVRGDMREVTFEQPFDALMCWGTTFGYFEEEENELVIRQLHQALKPKGALLIEVVNRDFMIGSQPNQVWFEVDGSVCMEETDFDYQTSRLRVKRRVATKDGNERDREYTIRLYALHEIRGMLERNGFRMTEVSGREATLGVFFGAHSPKMIVRAERLPGPFAEDNAPPPVPEDAGRRHSSQVMAAVRDEDDSSD